MIIVPDDDDAVAVSADVAVPIPVAVVVAVVIVVPHQANSWLDNVFVQVKGKWDEIIQNAHHDDDADDDEDCVKHERLRRVVGYHVEERHDAAVDVVVDDVVHGGGIGIDVEILIELIGVELIAIAR